jgi:hypothetical protein
MKILTSTVALPWRYLAGVGFLMAALLAPPNVFAQSRRVAPDFTGVYDLVPDGAVLPGRLRTDGSPEALELLPDAAAVAKSRDLSLDTVKDCQVIGTFRMMAHEGNRVDILPWLDNGRVIMMFEDHMLGHWREIVLDTPHDSMEPSWMGNSVGRFEGETLVVETIGFNEHIWLNSLGAPHSDVLKLTERYRLVAGGEYLELKMTADDSKVLTRPYTYTRYYKRSPREMQEYACMDGLIDEPIPAIP